MNTIPSTPYQQLFQSFGLRENPFRSLPDMRFLFLGRSYETALAEMMFGIESRCGLLALTGEPGTGKTLLVRRFLQWLGQRNSSSAYIFHSHMNTSGLFALIAQDFGIAAESPKKSDLLAAIQKWLQVRQSEGDSPVIVIDEAQALSSRALSELCLLLNLENSNGKLVQIVLAGQPELDEKLRQPELRQLRQRIGARCRLPLLTLEETAEYIESRIRTAGGGDAEIFSAETVQTLYSYAHGIPRVINSLCEKSLLAAYADHQNKISVANVRRAASEMELGFEPIEPRTRETVFRPSVVIPLEAPKAEPTPRQAAAEAQPYPSVVPPPAEVPAPASSLPPRPNVRVLSQNRRYRSSPVRNRRTPSPPLPQQQRKALRLLVVGRRLLSAAIGAMSRNRFCVTAGTSSPRFERALRLAAKCCL